MQEVLRQCSRCRQRLPRRLYFNLEWVENSYVRRCTACVVDAGAVDAGEAVVSRKCSSCQEDLSENHYLNTEWSKPSDSSDRRCTNCISFINIDPVLVFFHTVFSKEQENFFLSWKKKQEAATPRLLLLEAGQQDCPKNAFARLLPIYPPFKQLCNTVDPESRLYPLQKAAELRLSWDLGVRYIYEACQEVIGFPHPVSGLLPFQIAARADFVALEGNSVDQTTHLQWLELIYHLLHASPTLVQQPLFNPLAMEYRPEFFSGYETPMVALSRQEPAFTSGSDIYVYSDDDDSDEESLGSDDSG